MTKVLLCIPVITFNYFKQKMGFAADNNEGPKEISKEISKEKLLIIMSTLRLPLVCILVNIGSELNIFIV